MTIRLLAAPLLAATTMLVQPAFAAQVTPSQVDHDYGRLSHDALRAFADVDVARKAILAKDSKGAGEALADANGTLERAAHDNRLFLKAEAELHPATGVPAGHSGKLPSTATPGAPVYWLPILGEYVISQQSAQTPGQQQAIAEANNLLKQGKTRDAATILKNAGVDVQFVMAVAPQQEFTADVYRASVLLEGGNTDDALAALTDAQESLRFVSEDNILKSALHAPKATAPADSTAATTH